MARTARRTALTVLAMTSLLVGLLTACSSAEEPAGPVAPTPTSTATATQSSPSPSPTLSAEVDSSKPERPAAMDKRDADGAAAAAEYFLALYNYINKSGDTSEWAEMSHDVCTFCRNALERAMEIRKKDLTTDGGEVSSRLVEKYRRDAMTGIYPLDLEVTQQASTTTFPDGSVESSTEKQTALMRVEMGRRDGRWVVVTVAPKPEN